MFILYATLNIIQTVLYITTSAYITVIASLYNYVYIYTCIVPVGAPGSYLSET